MPEIVKVIPFIVGAISIITAIVGVTVYLTRLGLTGSQKMRACESELEQKKSTIAALEASVQGLSQSVQLLRKGRDDAFQLLSEINNLLSEASKRIAAKSDSILIKKPYSDDTLVFLTVHGDVAPKIKKMKVPIDSIGGRAMRSGRYSIFPGNEPGETVHFDRTDKKAGYSSDHILSVPLSVAGQVVGVVQFVNKADRSAFTKDDAAAVEPACNELAIRVRQLASDVATLRMLGIAEVAEEKSATIVFTDITESSALFDTLKTSEVVELMNEYFERLGSIALRNGATIDKFLGDGMMLRFNVPKAVPDYAAQAIRSAIDMQAEFGRITAEWQRLGHLAGDLKHRVGVATGPVIGGLIGHPQALSYSVMGETVSVAAHLCESARRTQSRIVANHETYTQAAAGLRDIASFSAIESMTPATYEVVPLARAKTQT